MNTIAIFDIGKTNKKLFLFNEQYQIVLERTVQFPEIIDEDGFLCDDVQQLSEWVKLSLQEILLHKEFTVQSVNFSAYGASFVYINSIGKVLSPLYNYLKPFPSILKENFYQKYGGAVEVSLATASPVLGNLNSGMQLYRIKNCHPALFEQIHYALHLPQYISYLVTGKAFSEITSIGCHTGLWDYTKKKYHDWVYSEKIAGKFPPILPSNKTVVSTVNGKSIKVGIGLHDSSSALIPYLTCFSEPFILLSTGTWCISFNPFNDDPLTAAELQLDCLCYIEYHGLPVKASRLFAGNEHEQQVKILATHFKVPVDYYQKMIFVPELLKKYHTSNYEAIAETGLHVSAFAERDLEKFSSYEDAYHQLIYDIIQQQKRSTSLVLSARKVSRIFVDGGFAQNHIFMHMLATSFPMMEVFAAVVSQASAIGAALAIHNAWNPLHIPSNLIKLKLFACPINHSLKA